SIVPQGRSRLYCVCRWQIGFCNCRRPLIHIFDGENVWHHVTSPMQFGALFASRHSSVIASGETITGLNTTLTGMALALSSAAAISCECFATAFKVSGP